MKRLVAFAALIMLLISLSACAGGGGNVFSTPEPTPEPTEREAEATEAPTAAPTEAPTAEPTVLATTAPAPTFAPYSAATGRLTEGRFLPDEAEYVVIKGESDIFYVYDAMGELYDTFHCETYESMYSGTGVFGPKGVTCGRAIATGEEIGNLDFLGDIIFNARYFENYEEGDTYYYQCITKVYNSDLELMFEFDRGEAQIGFMGGIIHVDGKLIVFDRDINWENDTAYYETEPKVYSESGEYLGTLDPEPFGMIMGVLGNKYIVGYGDGTEWPDVYSHSPVFDIYTLDGRRVMHNVGFEHNSSSFTADDEMWIGMLYGLDFVFDENGTYYDADLNPLAEAPDYTPYYRKLSRPYYALELEDAVYSAGSVYAGVKDAEGNWLFRIYNPGNASDSDNSEGERFWRVYGTWSKLQSKSGDWWY